MTSITPPGRPAHGFDHDGADRITEETSPDVGVPRQTVYTYNGDHQPITVSRPDGRTLTMTYDGAGRLSTVDSPRGQASHHYSASSGHLLRIDDVDGGSLQFSHDGPLLRQVISSGEVSGRLDLEYDSNLRVASRTLNEDATTRVAASYSDDDEVVSVDIGGQGTLTFDYAAANGLLDGTAVEGLVERFTRNGFAEITATTSFLNAESNWLYEADYLRDAGGRVTAKTERLRDPLNGATESLTSSYVYDLAGRLTEVQRDGAVVATYAYDDNSNRTSWSDDYGSHTATYDAQDRLLTFDDVTYSYNAAGDLASRSEGGIARSYDYDVFGNLRQLTLDDGAVIDYVIDAAGRRVGKKINGDLVKGWLYKDDLNPGAEVGPTGQIESLFVYGSQGNVPEVMVRFGRLYRLLTDQVGSVRLVVDAASGEIVQRLDYDAFGQVLFDSHPGFQPFGYAGGLYDYQTGLVRFGARDYDPQIGRWTSKDPIGFAGRDTNLYGYVANDPVNLNDPSGLAVPFLLGAVYAGLEGGFTLVDLVDLYTTFENPDATGGQKMASLGILAVGVVLPGGGYGQADDVAELGLRRSNKGKVVIDANAIIGALEEGQMSALDLALAGRVPLVPIVAAKEFLVKGDADALRNFLSARGGRLALAGSEQVSGRLRRHAQSLGRSLRTKDSRVAASALRENASLITRDKKFYNFLDASGLSVQRF